ncbi:MAG: S-methyl-5'-thioadenosine phosphorylase [Deltaproteobacteria bacterium HGW-Deltaproteobacteria-14]|jgi:5'-methylthioadenosine phosphorylase|nr:MAG: S-methyl-5'-thioadenosine phosphorylase [Deltaproteobacteria bacterium HGW-Deltaproteobacteria-14]
MTRAAIGIIGGSGLYAMDGVSDLREIRVETPYGPPSDAVMIGTVDGTPVAFLPRHGRGHRFAPHEINYRANIWALKSVGVKWLISVSAVGSLTEEIAPGELVIVDQFLDRTRQRASTFFEGGVVAHVGFGNPCCEILRGLLLRACDDVGVRHHDGGTYVCMEGPQFSTRAESFMYRGLGASVIGMTNLPEAKLAREAEMAYATIAMATDYDCWHETEEHVSVDAVVAVLHANVVNAQQLLRAVVPMLRTAPPSEAWTALDFAILTARDAIPATKRRELSLLLDRVLPPAEEIPS